MGEKEGKLAHAKNSQVLLSFFRFGLSLFPLRLPPPSPLSDFFFFLVFGCDEVVKDEEQQQESRRRLWMVLADAALGHG